MTRPYESPLREEQTAATRERILDAAWDLLRTTRPVDLGYTDVASAAGVSRRTVYRHFPSADDLFAGLAQRIAEATDGEDPSEMDRARAARMVKRQWEAMTRDPAVFRILFAAPVRSGLELERLIPRLFADELGALPEPSRAAAAGLIELLCSPYAWDMLHQTWSVDTDRALRASLVAMRALLDHLAEHPDHLEPTGPRLFDWEPE